jgi:hypothetical protein
LAHLNKGKRQIRRQSFAITSGKYQEVLDRHFSNSAEEKGKDVRKREDGIQERNMNFQNIWLKGNIIKK